MRKTAALVFCVLLAGIGFWLGETGLPVWAVAPIVCSLVGSVAAAFITPGVFWTRASVGVASLALFAATLFFGSQSFGHAFNECIEKGEDVRVLLKEYYEKTNQYPERLSELKRSVPCGRITKSTILVYERNETGYVLTFRDWLVEHTATESDAFMAKK